MKPSAKLKHSIFSITCLLLSLAAVNTARAHPTGNLVSIGDTAYFPYVYPIDHTGHRSSILSLQQGEQVKVVLTSQHNASDFMLSAQTNSQYIIERRYEQSSDQNYVRLLKLNADNTTNTIWPWFEDKWRLGEGGFHLQSEQQIIFVKYPNVLIHRGDGSVDKAFEFAHPVKRLRKVAQGLLLLGENQAWLVNLQGKVQKQWENLLNQTAENAPLNRNQIFDIDYHNNTLLVANWGNRSFDIHTKASSTTIQQLDAPYTAHWVNHFADSYLVMASSISFDGNNPRPLLILKAAANAQAQIIWQD